MMNSLINLPEDVLINNILLSKVLPANSLLSLRCVCQYLRNLITSPAFINMHLHHSTPIPPNHQLNQQLVLVDSEIPEEVFYSLKFNDGDGGDPSLPEVVMLDPPIKSPLIWGSCNGLLCLTALAEDEEEDDDDDKVCLWNPLTKEYKDLPPPLPLTDIPIGISKVRGKWDGSITYGFGYDHFIDDYKIIRCQHFVGHLDGDEQNYGDHISITEFQVYTLGTNTWRKISLDSNPYKSYFVLELQQDKPTPFVNGALHWIMSKSNCPWVDQDVSEWSEAKIISLDIEKEVFREIQTPFSELDYHYNYYKMGALRGCLCVLKFDWNEKCCNIWMMMDYGVKESWTKLFRIVQKEVEPLIVKKEDESFYENMISHCRLLRFFENGEILIETCDILFIYDPINNKARRVEFGENGMYLCHSVIYMESLVPLNSGVHKGEREFQGENEDEESYLIRAFGCIDLD